MTKHVKRSLVVTRNFTDETIGKLELFSEVSDLTLLQSVLAPAYIENADGTVELIEVSLIPADNALGLISRGLEHGKD